MDTERFLIRPMTVEDIPRLTEIRPGFVSDTYLDVEREGDGYLISWRLVEKRLEKPFDKGNAYDFTLDERRNIQHRLLQQESLEEVVIDRHSGRIVGVLDMTIEEWRWVSWIWNIMLDQDVRRQGIGRVLIEHSIAWTKRHKLRAVMLETQTNNVPACKFYAKMGFQLVGLNEVFYTNRDHQRREIALFWSYALR
ncbi:MAG: hypothetical protein CUN55_10110 [Phototrophicales bacterium]|nr:MAG: hypothetical protein CUN55_10110 [Phototrophicales bacterium]